MKQILILSLFFFSFSAFAQEEQQIPLPQKLQIQKLAELNETIDNMSFARKERYLDSLQTAGVLIRKTIPKNSKGCTLEDREELYGRPQQEVIIFLKK